MAEYRVTWEIDVDADSPQEAARKARAYQLKPDALVGVFDVSDKDGRTVSVDTDEPEDDDTEARITAGECRAEDRALDGRIEPNPAGYY